MMKIRSLLTLAGLVISCAVPAFAQQKDTADPVIVQQRDLLGVAKFGELGLKLDEANNKNDAVVVAALFTEGAVLLAPDGMFSGRQAIEKRYADTFQRSPITEFNSRRERRHLNAIDNAVWSAAQWASTLQSETGLVFALGYWSAI
jgi:ketosteroid isomerase-like protein